ncbi:unnamed protein product [Rotaria socialis]|uniref:Myb-like DNA-binding domain containing protein n=1 Tax=Rotaria socialis TaxID=392032 RepID=A0A820U528_9BILA|nr:unnamed protein product [Rotaria socialis]CAF3245237.1 unnamed protein product [Rotaria socialis]CAF3425233.1 unnamed protein product [Rotaria socialis]CAF4104817.1 unnamed protein product [Rotaria socialis]CAF4477569.1 unnamed protein product [Rotaria socialis]
MSSTVSSVFCASNISGHHKLNNEINLYEVFSLSKNNPIIASAFNSCYQKALLSLNEHIEGIDTTTVSSFKRSTYDVNEDDFDTTVFPKRSFTPSSTAICQWQHEQFLKEKFIRILIPIVAVNMYSIVLHWLELELKNEEERESRNEQNKNDLKNKIYELKSMENSIDVDKLYEFSGNSKDILIEQVDWKFVATKIRSKGGFKYFDEFALKRMWKHRCQYGLKNSWSDQEDTILNQLVEQFGFGKWNEISQHEMFQKNKKSAYMCSQRYMSTANKAFSKRRFTQNEKDLLSSMYKHRCSVIKDYRFCVSYASYLLGDRCLPEVTHVWAYINPDIKKNPFTPEEDAILLQYINKNPSICWAILVASHLPGRSAIQCRQRYFQLTKPQSSKKAKRTNKKVHVNNNHLKIV